MGQQGKKSLALLGVFACFLAVAAAGCGSSSGTTSSTTASAGGGASSGVAGGGATAKAGGGESANPRPSDAGASPPGPSGGGAASGGGGTNSNGAPLGSDTSKRGDNSIETYGSDAGGAEKAAVVASMRSFVRAIAARDFPNVCAQLAAKIRAGLAQSSKACPELLESLVVISPSEARRAASGTVTHVRVGGGNAFVLFRPAGGSRLNYFVMTEEGGKWKSLGLTIGTPLNPSAAVGK
jgi:hypothetical protein